MAQSSMFDCWGMNLLEMGLWSWCIWVCKWQLYHKLKTYQSTKGMNNKHSSNWNSHSHPWPEWSTLIHHLSLSSHFNFNPIIAADDEFAVPLHLPDHFMHAATGCLAFTGHQPNILGFVTFLYPTSFTKWCCTNHNVSSFRFCEIYRVCSIIG